MLIHKNHIFHVLGLLFLLAPTLSCDRFVRDIDMTRRLSGEDIVFLTALADNQEEDLKVRAVIARSLSAPQRPRKSTLQLTLQVNGKDVKVEPLPVDDAVYEEEHLFRASYRTLPGDRISVMASSSGVQTAHAELTVVPAPGAFLLERKNIITDKQAPGEQPKDTLSECHEFKLTFLEPPGEDACFGVQVLKCTEVDGILPDDYEPVDGDTDFGSVIYDDIYSWRNSDSYSTGRQKDLVTTFGEGDMQLFDTFQKEDGKVVLRVAVRRPEDRILAPGCRTRTRYKLLVSRVSLSYYRYVQKTSSDQSGGLPALGVGSMVNAYTNIIGGTGFFGAKVTESTEWLYTK